MGFLKFIVQVFFVCFELAWVGGLKGGGFEGWGFESGARRVGGPTQKKWGPKGWSPEGWGERWGGRRVGGSKFRAFFSLSRRKIRSFLPSLGIFSWNFGGV